MVRLYPAREAVLARLRRALNKFIRAGTVRKRLAVIVIVAGTTSGISFGARADCDLDQVIGYALVAAPTIEGYIQDGQRKDDFEGCDFDRIIVFADGTGVRCTSYGYSYSYRPKAYVFVSGLSMKMCVSGNFYSVTRLR
jgi:hypothetical protein